MNEQISQTLVWLRIPILLLGTVLIVRIIYFLTFKKEKRKIQALKETIRQQEAWTSPLFNNGGFVVGMLIFLLGFVSIIFGIQDPAYGMPIIASVGLVVLGLFMIWGTPFIQVKKEHIEFQPLLFKLLSLNLSKKSISFNDIQKVTKSTNMPPFITLQIYTKSSEKFKLNTAMFNSEVGNALYEILNENP